MFKVIVFCPEEAVDKLVDAMSDAGAGVIGNYSHCAFITKGTGTWFSKQGSNPTIGKVGKLSKEVQYKIEMVCPEEKLQNVKEAILKVHPYETPEINFIKLYS